MLRSRRDREVDSNERGRQLFLSLAWLCRRDNSRCQYGVYPGRLTRVGTIAASTSVIQPQIWQAEEDSRKRCDFALELLPGKGPRRLRE